VPALLKEEVSFVEPSRWLPPKRFFLVEGDVRSYMVWYVRTQMTIDEE
jgi:hypothetical protein